MGIEPHQVFAHPLHFADVICQRFDGGVGDGSARAKKQCGNSSTGNDEFALVLIDNDRSVFLLYSAVLEVQEADAIARLGQRSQSGHDIYLELK
jgi:hypothetical protein